MRTVELIQFHTEHTEEFGPQPLIGKWYRLINLNSWYEDSYENDDGETIFEECEAIKIGLTAKNGLMISEYIPSKGVTYSILKLNLKDDSKLFTARR